MPEFKFSEYVIKNVIFIIVKIGELYCPAKTEHKLALGGWHSANALALLFLHDTKTVNNMLLALWL